MSYVHTDPQNLAWAVTALILVLICCIRAGSFALAILPGAAAFSRNERFLFASAIGMLLVSFAVGLIPCCGIGLVVLAILFFALHASPRRF